MAGPARPQGITILAILAFVAGAFGLLGGLGTLGLGSLLGSVAGVGGLFQILGFVLLALSVVELAVGYGFWTLKSWAWSLAFILFAANILLQALMLVSWGGYGFTNIIVGVVFAGIVVYYLHQPNVRQAFGAPASGFPLVGNALDKYIPGGK
jgi:hypothetical protein